MKKISLILTVALVGFFSAHSQSLHIGIKGGANINKLTGQSFSDKFSFGYQIGGFAEIGLSKKWSINPEVLWTQVNVDTSDKFSSIYSNLDGRLSNVKLKYLNIPVLLNYNLSNMVSLQAGPQFGILLDQDKNLVQNGKDAFKKGDFSLLGGLQFKFSNFRVYGRYAVGLNNINDIDNRDRWKSQSFQLGVGLAIL